MVETTIISSNSYGSATFQPSLASRNLTGHRFVDLLASYAKTSPAISHQYLYHFQRGEFANFDLAVSDFAAHYQVYSSSFPRYVRAVLNNLTNDRHKALLEENLQEETGNSDASDLPSELMMQVRGVPHSTLFKRFCEAASDSAGNEEPPPLSEVASLWKQNFLSLCELDECVGIGALGIGTELIVSDIYKQILPGLTNFSNISDKNRVFFDLHCACDDAHADQILSIAAELAVDVAACERLEFGTKCAIHLRTLFWTKLLQRAQTK